MTSNRDIPTDSPASEALDFIRWAAQTLGLDLSREDEGLYCLSLPAESDALGPTPPDEAEAAPPARRLWFAPKAAGTARDAPTSSEEPSIEPIARVVAILAQRLVEWGRLPDAVPVDQPTSVHELTPALFGAYRTEGGRVHLGGCLFEDRPMLRITWTTAEGVDVAETSKPADGADSSPSSKPADSPDGSDASETSPAAGVPIEHAWFDISGHPVDADTVASLGLARLEPLKERPERVTDEQFRTVFVTAENEVLARVDRPRLLARAVAWCKFATGKLVFAFGEQWVEQPFRSWAKWIAEGRYKPPPLKCPATGVETYHLALTEDGEIAAAEQIEACGHSGRRVLKSTLETCAVTQRRVLPEFIEPCPVTGARVARSAKMECQMCRQSVSPSTIRAGRCAACRTLRRVGKGDARMARILGEIPGLDQWRNWKMSETRTVYILIARGVVRRLLVVLDKDSLEPLRLATGSRLWPGWRELPELEREELVGR